MQISQRKLVEDSLLAVHSPDVYANRTFSTPVVVEVLPPDAQLSLEEPSEPERS